MHSKQNLPRATRPVEFEKGSRACTAVVLFHSGARSMNQTSNAYLAAALAGLLAPAAIAGPSATSDIATPATMAGQPDKPAPASPVPRTKVSTQIFINASDLQRSGVTRDDEGLAVELKRLYINVDHTFNDNWSGHLTTDVQWLRNSDPTDLLFRHAYLERRLGKSQHLQLGNAPTPWILHVAKLNGFRYVDPGVIPRMKLGVPADWGVQVGGDVGQFNYQVAAVTGAGFQKPRIGERADIEARVSWKPIKQFEAAIGGYHGTRAMDVDTPHLHTAERWNAMATWIDKDFRVGAEFFYADNWTRVTQVSPDAARGWSGWGSYQLTPAFAAFARHDRTDMSLRLDPSREERFSQFGLEWKQSKHVKLALVGKRTEVASSKVNATANEAGIWGQMVF